MLGPGQLHCLRRHNRRAQIGRGGAKSYRDSLSLLPTRRDGNSLLILGAGPFSAKTDHSPRQKGHSPSGMKFAARSLRISVSYVETRIMAQAPPRVICSSTMPESFSGCLRRLQSFSFSGRFPAGLYRPMRHRLYVLLGAFCPIPAAQDPLGIVLCPPRSCGHNLPSPLVHGHRRLSKGVDRIAVGIPVIYSDPLAYRVHCQRHI